MAMITVRNLDDAAKRRLQRRAAANGTSMEAEARAALEAVREPDEETGIFAAMRAAHTAMGRGGFDLQERADDFPRDPGLS
ncbi:MAG: hypothetical protein LBK59_07415 [Bifidobacteriaceae bacterium]|jgi:plasmid stability protein|nr:hypothetical protein [Bifidobacteriaceae bacterium]